jgi:hypothetical protein
MEPIPTLPNTDLISTLLNVLAWAAGTGAGAVASWLQSTARQMFPVPDAPPRLALARAAYRWLHAPRYSLRLAFALTVIVSAAATGAITAINVATTGASWWSALSAGLGVAFGVILNQIAHRDSKLSPDVPQWKQPEE